MTIEWKTATGLTAYPDAVDTMENRVTSIIDGTAGEQVWLVEHPPLYTVGTSGKDGDMLEVGKFPTFQSGRGGQITYHGPGQRVAYVMLDLKKREPDIRRYVESLERWMISTLAHYGIEGFIREGRVGVWVNDPKRGEAKIGAIGIRLRKWVSFHGLSLNVHPDLSHYDGIVPCGISQYGVTSLKELGVDASMADVDIVLKQEFAKLFS